MWKAANSLLLLLYLFCLQAPPPPPPPPSPRVSTTYGRGYSGEEECAKTTSIGKKGPAKNEGTLQPSSHLEFPRKRYN